MTMNDKNMLMLLGPPPMKKPIIIATNETTGVTDTLSGIEGAGGAVGVVGCTKQ